MDKPNDRRRKLPKTCVNAAFVPDCSKVSALRSLFNPQAIILVHWLLTVWGCMNNSFPASYAWGNFSVLAVGIWAIVQRDSLDAIVMFLSGLLFTVLTDIIHISVYYPLHAYLIDAKRFSMGMAIFSLLLKPGSCYFVYRMYRERGGEYIFNIGLNRAGRDRSAYETIDQQDASPLWPDSSKTAQQPY
ncbi:type-1 angiotensin II receptor-associated protein isoform X2 [Coturnix japonica]|uniref:type-1 angiotensin II receptor-associated protein isoform X2 n=1 Tax=Coturnix japonica TaxID=93934 RepID=UPI0013A5D5B7|nr:type-1 angiotensin II receptor-associated protein isoform X2 [Coturnix japonica]